MNKIRKLPFVKSTFQLTIGSLLAQIITFICSPIVTRIYSVEEMGIYALILSIVAIFGSVINGKYDLAIVSTKNEEDVFPLIVTSFFISIFFTIFVGLGLTVYILFFPNIWNQLGFWMYISLLILLMTGLSNIFISFNNRFKEYKVISNVSIIRAAVQNILLIAFGTFKFGAIGMANSQLVGSACGLKYQSRSMRNKYKENNKRIEFTRIKDILINYKSFPLYSLPANLINNVSYTILNFFISALFGLKILGLYSMTYRILGLPLSLISVNVSKVFFREAAEEYSENGSFKKSLIKSTLLLSAMALPMFLILYFFSPIIFQVSFGKEWYTAGIYARILAFMFSIRLIVSALTPAFIVSSKQRLELVFQILFLASSIISFIVTKIYSLDINIFLYIYSLINSIVYIFLYLVIWKLSKGRKIRYD